MLLDQVTIGGKSLARQNVGIIKGSIALIVKNFLSLSSDQVSRINAMLQKCDGDSATQLDSIKDNHHINENITH